MRGSPFSPFDWTLQRVRTQRWLALPLALALGGLLVALLFAVLPAGGAAAAPAAEPAVAYPCNQTGLNAALAAGGSATFSCLAPTTVTVSSAPKLVNKNVSLDGGNKLILSGGGITGVFTVAAGIHLNLLNLTVRDASLSIGAGVYNNGYLAITHSQFISNLAGLGGAVFNAPGATTSVFDSHFEINVGKGAMLWNGPGFFSSTTPATMTVVNSTFLANSAGEGGAMFNALGLMTVNGSQFLGNNASIGGAIFNQSQLRVHGSQFIYNGAGTVFDSQAQLLDQPAGLGLPAGVLAGGTGGAIYASQLADTLIATSSFTGNVSTDGGGAVFNGVLPPALFGPFPNNLVISASQFANNCSGGPGGALFSSLLAKVSDSSFSFNLADSSAIPCIVVAASRPGARVPAGGVAAPVVSARPTNGAGGAVFNSGRLAVDHVTFLGNSATVTSTGGGGAITNYPYADLSVAFSSFTDNSAIMDGGAIFNDLYSPATVAFSDFTHNTAQHDSGGAVASLGYFTVTESLFTRNYGAPGLDTIGRGGGAIYSYDGPIVAGLAPSNQNGSRPAQHTQAPQGSLPAPRLFVDHTQFISNSSEYEGGAIDSGLALIQRSTFFSNTAAFGGALDVLDDDFVVSGSTFIANATISTTFFLADEGGAIDANGRAMRVLNSTFYANHVPSGAFGGAIQVEGGAMTVTNSSFISNTAATSGHGGALAGNGALVARNLLIAYNGGGNCDVAMTLDAHNLDYPNTTCGGSALHLNPLALAPANNGGPTLTSALLPNSPAINAGNDATCPATDQRGGHRPVGAHCDLGAFEFGAQVPWLWLPLVVK